jgi:hypothetical protein
VWESQVDGRALRFHLAGINNQNFIMRDEETGSWWQQVTGEAIFGPLKGARLRQVYHEELTFATWRGERPEGRVLRPDDTAPWRRFSEDWEAKTAGMPVVTPADQSDAFAPRDLVVGVALGGESKAYPVAALQRARAIVDIVGGVPLILVLGEDDRSIRAFERVVNGEQTELFVRPGSSPLRLVDARTGSEWDFEGRATAGPLAWSGQQLRRLAILQDYWFDWKTYHPDTGVYRLE